MERAEFMDLPIVNDTFIVFPYKMLEPFFDAWLRWKQILHME